MFIDLQINKLVIHEAKILISFTFRTDRKQSGLKSILLKNFIIA